MIGIYKLTNAVNMKIYIGQSKDIQKRMKYHISDSKKEKNKNNKLYSDFNEYGVENFKISILEECSMELLDEREEYYIRKFNSTDPAIGYNFSEKAVAFKDKRVRANNGKVSGKRIAEFNNKMWKNKEYRDKMSKQSRDVQLERLKNPEYLEEKSAQLKQATDKMKLKVGKFDKQGNLLEVYNGVREAERKNKLPNDLIGKVCRGVKYRKTAGGYIWKYLKEEV